MLKFCHNEWYKLMVQISAGRECHNSGPHTENAFLSSCVLVYHHGITTAESEAVGKKGKGRIQGKFPVGIGQQINPELDKYTTRLA